MNIVTAKVVPPPPSPDQFVVTIWIRERSGIITKRRAETDASTEDAAKWSVVRHFGLHRGDGMSGVVDIDVRRRKEMA